MTTSHIYEPELRINPNTRKIYVPNELYNICVSTDDNSEIIKIRIPRYFDGYDFSSKECSVIYNNALMERGRYSITDREIFDDSLLLHWCISNHVTKAKGKIYFVVEFKTSNAEHNKTYSWSTMPAELNILPWLDNNVSYTDSSNDSNIIESIRQDSHKHQNMDVLNRVTQEMTELLEYMKPAYESIINHISKIGKADGMHIPNGGEVGQVLGRVPNSPGSESFPYAWIDMETRGNAEIPENVSAFRNDAGYQDRNGVEKIITENISGKVDKIAGKGLSENDYTNDDKSKLMGIPNIIFSTVIPSVLDENTICFVYED